MFVGVGACAVHVCVGRLVCVLFCACVGACVWVRVCVGAWVV